MRRIAWLAAVAAVAAVVWALRSDAPAPPVAPPLPDGATAEAPSADPPAPPPGEAPLPRGLRGTRPSGGLTVDARGHFVPDHDARLFFGLCRR